MAPARTTGHYELTSTAGETVRAFIPAALPPHPPLDLSESAREALDRAHLSLGRLAQAATAVPDPTVFLDSYVRKEAVLSSQIEGTQSSLADLLLFETGEPPSVPVDDVTEVSNYVQALEHSFRRLEEGLPISGRLLREAHAILLSAGPGRNRQPGEFRRSQNWIGGTNPANAHFVPPPAEQVPECVAALERFIHDIPGRTPPLIKAGLAHAQFETIHPFLDGNGRVGRLLIALVLTAEDLLPAPLLYVSLYFRQHRQAYYRRLDAIRIEGDWEGWLDFFAKAVTASAEDAVDTISQMEALFETDSDRVRTLGRKAHSARKVLEALRKRPIQDTGRLAERTGLSFPTVSSTLRELGGLGIVVEVTGRRRDRRFVYRKLLELLKA